MVYYCFEYEEGWILIERTQKCYTFLSTSKRISFVDAQHQCERKNSSVFKINPDSEDVLPANLHSYNIVDLVKQAYYIIYYIKLDHNFVSQAIHHVVISISIHWQLFYL